MNGHEFQVRKASYNKLTIGLGHPTSAFLNPLDWKKMQRVRHISNAGVAGRGRYNLMIQKHVLTLVAPPMPDLQHVIFSIGATFPVSIQI